MAWLEKLFINFSTHLSNGRCGCLPSQRSLSCASWIGSTGVLFRAILCSSRFVTRESSVITLGLCASWQICQGYSAHRDDFRLPAMRCYFPFASTMGFQVHDNWNTIICIRDPCLLWTQKAGPSSLDPLTSILHLEELQC